MARRNGARQSTVTHAATSPPHTPGRLSRHRGHQEAERQGHDGHAHDGVDHRDAQQGHDELAPQALMVHRMPARGIARQERLPTLGQVRVHILRGGPGQADHVGRQERGDDRHRHHDGVEEVSRHAQRHAQRGDDEGKLADLRQAEAALHGRLQRLAGQEHAQRAEQGLARDHGQRDDQDGHGIGHDHRRVHHHAHGHEEDGPEQVLHRGDQPLDMLGLYRLGQDGAHDEGAKRGREARARRQHHHAEAHGQGHDEQRLVAHQAAALLQQQGDEVDAHHEPQDEEEEQLGHALQHLRALEVVAHGHRAEHHHQDDGQDVLQDEHAQHQPRELLLAQPQVVESLVDDGGGRHGDHPAQEEAVHLAPPEGRTHRHAQQDHAEDHRARRDHCRAAHLDDLLEAELQPQGEEQEHHADVRPHLHAGALHHRGREGHVRAGQEAGHDVAQHQRLLQPLEDQRHDARAEQDQGEVGYQRSQF